MANLGWSITWPDSGQSTPWPVIVWSKQMARDWLVKTWPNYGPRLVRLKHGWRLVRPKHGQRSNGLNHSQKLVDEKQGVRLEIRLVGQKHGQR
jgi:nitrogen fixation protein